MDLARLVLHTLAAALLAAALIFIGRASGMSRGLLLDIVIFVAAGFLTTVVISELKE